MLENNKNKIIVSILILVVFVFSVLIFISTDDGSSIYFLDVGQGDSEFIKLSGINVLIDGGPIGGGVINELSRVMSPFDRYIDLVIMTHPQDDHFGGLIDVMKRYKVGAFLYNGQKSNSLALKDLERAIKENGSKIIKLKAGDNISYKDSVITILSPSQKINDLNNSSLVLKLETKKIGALFTGDIGYNVEKNIEEEVGNINILKVPHHGSKYSSSASFLDLIDPEVSVIQVGKNSYGHPTDETINRLKKVNSRIYRTDLDGTIKIDIDKDFLDVFTSR